MAKQIIGGLIKKSPHNVNYKELYDIVYSLKGRFILKEPVATFADLSTTYPDPEVGDAVHVQADYVIYRWNRFEWEVAVDLTVIEIAEEVRISNENTRVSNENTRIANENIRIATEDERIAAELLRLDYFYVTQAEYDALPQEDKDNPKNVYEITDDDGVLPNELQVLIDDVTLAKNTYDTATTNDTNLEVVDARTSSVSGSTSPTLKSRLDGIDTSLLDIDGGTF